MVDPVYPCFIDIEASSLGDDSWPVEIAWSTTDGSIRRFLVRPEPDWQDWSPRSQAVHGISRERAERNGWAAIYVCEQLTHDLAGTVPHSTAPDFDNAWLKRLFEPSGQPPPVRIEHLDELLLPVVKQADEMAWQAMVRIERIKSEVRERMHSIHTAGGDVGYLIQVWHRVTGRPVTMNHDVGPLLSASDTGTFLNLKGRLARRSDDGDHPALVRRFD